MSSSPCISLPCCTYCRLTAASAPQVAIRELISNSSDALDKVRALATLAQLALTKPALPGRSVVVHAWNAKVFALAVQLQRPALAKGRGAGTLCLHLRSLSVFARHAFTCAALALLIRDVQKHMGS